MSEQFDKLDQIIRIILFIPIWGGIVSGIYRILVFTENKNILMLLLGILCLITPVGTIMSIIDLVTTCIDNKVKILAK